MESVVIGPSRPVALKTFGQALIGMALCFAALAVLKPSGLLASVLLGLSMGIAVIGSLATFRMVGVGPSMALDSDGFVNRTSLGVGTKKGTWPEVEEILISKRGLVILLLDGNRKSVINPAPLGYSAADMATKLRGYLGRPLN